MSDNPTAAPLEPEELDDNDLDMDDFGFIIGADGNLKSVMFPDKLMDDPPLEVLMILKIFGIENIEDVEIKTIH